MINFAKFVSMAQFVITILVVFAILLGGKINLSGTAGLAMCVVSLFVMVVVQLLAIIAENTKKERI